MAIRISPSKQVSNKFFGEGLTFDDVLLMPGYSQVLPRDVSIKSQLTKDITLNVPLLSAAMDTVTEASLATALAREGGLGILHKNMTIEKQAEQVRKVKRSESGLIIDPVTLLADATIGDALKLMRENKIGGIPIIDKNGKLVGILTNRDLRFETNYKDKVSSVMTKENLITAPEGTDSASPVYGEKDVLIRYLCLDLLWRPIRRLGLPFTRKSVGASVTGCRL